jgi:hypothetical protein
MFLLTSPEKGLETSSRWFWEPALQLVSWDVRPLRWLWESALEKYSLCQSLTVKFLLHFLRPCWPAYLRFALALNYTRRKRRASDIDWIPVIWRRGPQAAIRRSSFPRNGKTKKRASLTQKTRIDNHFFIPGRNYMNFEIFFQLIALFFILAAGPLVIVLLAARSGNL